MYSEVSPFHEETIKDELHTLSETIKKEKIKEKIQKNTLNIGGSSSKEVQEILHFLIKNKNDYKNLKIILIPETFFYENDAHVKLLLDVLDTFDKISIKTDKGYDIPRPPKSL